VTQATLVLNFYLSVLEKLSLCIRLPNFKSVSLLVLEIFEGMHAKFYKGSRDLGHDHFRIFSFCCSSLPILMEVGSN